MPEGLHSLIMKRSPVRVWSGSSEPVAQMGERLGISHLFVEYFICPLSSVVRVPSHPDWEVPGSSPGAGTTLRGGGAVSLAGLISRRSPVRFWPAQYGEFRVRRRVLVLTGLEVQQKCRMRW